MSKQSEAKEKQGYDPKPIQPTCMNCKHYSSEKVSESYGWHKEWTREVEKKKRCTLGGFAVKKTGSCKKDHEFKPNH